MEEKTGVTICFTKAPSFVPFKIDTRIANLFFVEKLDGSEYTNDDKIICDLDDYHPNTASQLVISNFFSTCLQCFENFYYQCDDPNCLTKEPMELIDEYIEYILHGNDKPCSHDAEEFFTDDNMRHYFKRKCFDVPFLIFLGAHCNKYVHFMLSTIAVDIQDSVLILRYIGDTGCYRWISLQVKKSSDTEMFFCSFEEHDVVEYLAMTPTFAQYILFNYTDMIQSKLKLKDLGLKAFDTDTLKFEDTTNKKRRRSNKC